jgi:hypothetical protein
MLGCSLLNFCRMLFTQLLNLQESDALYSTSESALKIAESGRDSQSLLEHGK